VSLEWEPVEGAIGYIVHRAASVEGPFAPVDHRGGDVLAVPGCTYSDTTGEPGARVWYAVSSIAAIESLEGEVSEPIEARSNAEPAAPMTVLVRADRDAGRLERPWHLIGSERLSQLITDERSGGRDVASEFAEALRRAHVELGVERVRAHAILHDDLAVYSDSGYDFSRIDAVYDRLLELGLRPLVEVSFMPRDLARDPEESVFEYRGLISPPEDWDRWGELNRRLAEHLVDRYGLDEVAGWGFEIWNEPNLEVFWSGTQAEYFRLYEVAARAIKSVDERLPVGGPSTAAAGWVTDFVEFCREHDVPFEFVSTHTYGNIPLDFRRRGDLEGVDVLWTEWGVTPTHFASVTDEAFGGPFALHGMKSAHGRIDGLAYWVVSDHFEELGRPPRLLHGGFGLLTVGNLRKARWWALRLAEELDDRLVGLQLGGDGAGTLVDGWASRGEDGTIQLLVWNGTLDQSKVEGDPLLERTLQIDIDGLDARGYSVSLARIDAGHSNVAGRWDASRDWPSEDEWEQLQAGDRLHDEQLDDVSGPNVSFTLELPMPGVARLRLTPRG
jgi:xylan 1,4-beta-xylosidase